MAGAAVGSCVDSTAYRNRPSPRTEHLDEWLEKLEAARDERTRKVIAEELAGQILDTGRREYRGWRVVDHLRVDVLDGREAEAAKWMAQHGVKSLRTRRGRKSDRRALGREFERAGIGHLDVPEELFDVMVRWSIRQIPARRAST